MRAKNRLIKCLVFFPDFVPNSSDEEGRYSYKNQPSVGFFNLEKLLQALKPVIEDYGA